MKPTRNKLPPRKTPAKQKSKDSVKDAVKVFCRIRPLENENEISCLRLESSTTVVISPPENAVNFKNNNYKEIVYTFKQVFSENSTQKEVFDTVALPLVEGLVQGKNGLLFTYGVTGSGKTYTMTGQNRDGGIMPRCLDVLFNSIGKYQAPKYLFKPDKMNGFDVQCNADAMLDRQQDMHNIIVGGKVPKTPRRKDSDEDLSSRVCDPTSVSCIEEDNTFAVFVNYVEIYNNNVYDLLEDISDEPIRSRALQTKIIREDAGRNMYAHMVTEIEVKSSVEAFQAFYKGQKKKRMAHTMLNAESSRSHSVFTIRLVQIPLDERGEEPMLDKNALHVSQLSLVDLAGSERTNRTKNTGQRLREAGNINNSLMSLRACLEVLRENQQTGSNKMVPYRDSKLTLLFKNYFDGEGQVEMIVCVNPRADDFDETVHVMKFAEMTQEVQVTQPNAIQIPNDLASGRRNANEVFKEALQQIQAADMNGMQDFLSTLPFHRLSPPFPNLELRDPQDESLLRELIQFLELRLIRRNSIHEEILKKQSEFRNQLINVEKTNILVTQENSSLKATIDAERKKNVVLENKLVEKEAFIASLQSKLKEKEKTIISRDQELHEKSLRLKQMTAEKENVKQQYNEKITAEKEKLAREMQLKLREKDALMKNQLRENKEKIRKMKKIVNEENPTPHTPFAVSSWQPNAKSESHLPSATSSNSDRNVVPSQFLTPHIRKHGFMATTPRRRRSRSVGNEIWIDHRPGIPTELDTVLQPNVKRRKSVSKLTDAKDVTNSKASKYMLMTQDLDSAGETETHIYKADVVPTTCGGAQVIFNDVETLSVRSPTSPNRKRRSPGARSEETAQRCAVSVEGHGKRPKI